MSSDRVSHILTAAFFAGVLLGMAFYRTVLAVPAPGEQAIDPSGHYDSRVGDNAEVLYQVIIEKDENGKVTSAWGRNGRTHYVGTLTCKEGVWTETYSESPGLNRSGPWTWNMTNREPLAFEDDRKDGWTLTVALADF